jgi:2-keto-4-pentenoate hydratase/2-oxohepta-3-ene-1,7-dioic acid hydratase in catechol pathway
MKLLNFVANGEIRSGIATDKGVIDVAAANQALGANAPTTIAGLAEGQDALNSLVSAAKGGEAWLLDQSMLRLGPCVADPGKIICIGLNYARHAAESNQPIPSHPVVFSKFNNTLAGDGEDVPMPVDVASQFDYEAELCAVIGKTA